MTMKRTGVKAMQRTTLYISEHVWRDFRVGCMKRNIAASPQVELLMREQLVAWHKEDEETEKEQRLLTEEHNRKARAQREAEWKAKREATLNEVSEGD
jgi:hypothetical protein